MRDTFALEATSPIGFTMLIAPDLHFKKSLIAYVAEAYSPTNKYSPCCGDLETLGGNRLDLADYIDYLTADLSSSDFLSSPLQPCIFLSNLNRYFISSHQTKKCISPASSLGSLSVFCPPLTPTLI